MRKVRDYIGRHHIAFLALFVALGGTSYAAATIGSHHVVDESLRGVDIRNGSLSRTDLGVTVRSARQTSDSCGENHNVFDDCVSLRLALPRPQRVLLVASGEWFSSDDSRAQCGFRIDGGVLIGAREFGQRNAESHPFNFAANTVTGVLPRGERRISLSCKELVVPPTTYGEIGIRKANLSAAAVGDG